MAAFVWSLTLWAFVATCMAQQVAVSMTNKDDPEYDINDINQWDTIRAVEEFLWNQEPEEVTPPVVHEEVKPFQSTTEVLQSTRTTEYPEVLQSTSTTEYPAVIKEQDTDVGEMFVFKIFLVVATLLVTVVGSVGVGYYLCVWRGGRIHYQPQREFSMMT